MIRPEIFEKKVNKLELDQARGLLKLTYIGLDMAINGNGGTEEMQEILKELFDMYQEIEV